MLAAIGRMYSCNPILFSNAERVLGNQGRPGIQLGFIGEPAPRSPA